MPSPPPPTRLQSTQLSPHGSLACKEDRSTDPLSPLRSLPARKNASQVQKPAAVAPTFHPAIPSLSRGHSRFRDGPRRRESGLVPFLLRAGGGCGRLGVELSKKRGRCRQAGQPATRGSSARPAAPHLFFSSSWVSSGWGSGRSRAAGPGTVTFGKLRVCFYKVSSGRRFGRPPGSPPAPPPWGGLGRGRGL